MKKNLLTIVFALLALLMFIYAFVQKLEADVQHEKAFESQAEAEKNFEMAEASRKEADMQRALAMENEKKAITLQDALMKCQKGKK